MRRDLREESRRSYGTRDKNATVEELNAGALCRIADSLEKMEKPYLRLLDDVACLRREYQERGDEIERLGRVVAGLRGHITKLKKETP